MTINTKFTIGQIVFLKTDTDQKPRIVLGIAVYPTTLKYILGQGDDDSVHYDIEISTEKNILI